MKKNTMKGVLDELTDDGEQAIVYFSIRGNLFGERLREFPQFFEKIPRNRLGTS